QPGLRRPFARKCLHREAYPMFARLVKRVLIWTLISLRMLLLRLAGTALGSVSAPCRTRTDPQTIFAFLNLFLSPRPNSREGMSGTAASPLFPVLSGDGCLCRVQRR